jgi:hypothetical protein
VVKSLTFANRCTSVKPRTKLPVSSSIVFLAKEWEGRDFNEVIPPRKIKDRDGKVQEMPQVWHLLEPRTVALKNIGNFEIQELVNTSMHLPTQSMEERARDALEMLHQEGLYRIQ